MSVYLQDLVEHLNSYLCVDQFKESAINGLQVEGSRIVHKIAFAVDGVQATFQAAAEADADLLVVHHGIYWGRQWPLVGSDFTRIKTLIENGLGLYAAHLPLDAHFEVGHAATLLRALHVEETSLEAFGHYKGMTTGFQGQLSEPVDRDDFEAQLRQCLGQDIQCLSFGSASISRIACVTGQGAGFDMLDEARQQRCDYYISGEANHPVFHYVREARLNLALGGHYLTEVFGTKALMEHVRKCFDVAVTFIDHPTGL